MRSTRTNEKLTRTAWTDSETKALIRLYCKMRKLEAKGLLGPKKSAGQQSKKQLVREWIAKHSPHRTNGSVDLKLMNISASFVEHDLEPVAGYKPLPNRAKALDDLVAAVMKIGIVLLTVAA